MHLLTKQLATEWAKHRINVNAIAPSIFWTPLTQQVRDNPEMVKIFMARIPMGRAAELDDFIGAAVYLASPASDYVTGLILSVDGGAVADEELQDIKKIAIIGSGMMGTVAPWCLPAPATPVTSLRVDARGAGEGRGEHAQAT